MSRRRSKATKKKAESRKGLEDANQGDLLASIEEEDVPVDASGADQVEAEEFETEADDPVAEESKAGDPEDDDPEAEESEAEESETEAKDPEAQDPEAQDPEAKDPEAQDPEAEAPKPRVSETDETPDSGEDLVTERLPGLDGERVQRAGDLVANGRPQEAIAVYLKILGENPDHLTARHNLGVLYDELGRHAEAIEALEAARDLEPDHSEVLANLGAALAAVGRFDAADEHIKRAVRLDPENITVRASLAILAFRRGLYEVAEAELRWVCERDPTHGSAHFYRGEALNRMGRVDEALDVLEKTRQLQPWNHRIFHTMGMLYDKKHEPQLAAESYRRARAATRP